MTEHDEASTAVILIGFVIAASIGVAIAAFGWWVWNESSFSLFEKTLLTTIAVGLTANAIAK